MNTEHPTVEFYFVMAFTYCRLRVYKTEEAFARKILEANDQIEIVDPKASDGYEEVDTRILLVLLGKALPKLITETLISEEQIRKVFKIKPS